VSLSKESKFFLTMLELLRLFCVKMTVSFLGAISQMVWLECEMSTTARMLNTTVVPRWWYYPK
jgi:hypothetical protein